MSLGGLCIRDLDCRTEARCRIDQDGVGTCMESCTVDADCPVAFTCDEGTCGSIQPPPSESSDDFATCQVDADCRTSEGASCMDGRCATGIDDADGGDADVDGG